jgi:hypothetical protein
MVSIAWDLFFFTFPFYFPSTSIPRCCPWIPFYDDPLRILFLYTPVPISDNAQSSAHIELLSLLIELLSLLSPFHLSNLVVQQSSFLKIWCFFIHPPFDPFDIYLHIIVFSHPRNLSDQKQVLAHLVHCSHRYFLLLILPRSVSKKNSAHKFVQNFTSLIGYIMCP